MLALVDAKSNTIHNKATQVLNSSKLANMRYATKTVDTTYNNIPFSAAFWRSSTKMSFFRSWMISLVSAIFLIFCKGKVNQI